MLNLCINKTLNHIKEIINSDKFNNDSIKEALLYTNIRYLSIVSLLTIPIFIIPILLFWRMDLSTAEENLWRNSLLICYVSIIFVMICLRLLIWIFSKREKRSWIFKVIQWIGLLAIIIVGIAIVTIDQLVTTNITPFMLVCMIVSIFFLLNPLQNFFLYIGVYLVYFWALGLTQTNISVLLSNRINGIISVALAFTLSLVLWRNAVVNKQQEQKLAKQQNELEEKNRLLQKQANFDNLTGLCNRRLFREMTEKEILYIKRSKSPASIMLIDLDLFKSINDKYGHPVGDILLKQISALIKRELRESDLVSRWGGEEFLCLMRNTDLASAASIAERLRYLIENSIFCEPLEAVSITASIGISALGDYSENDFEKAYMYADKAMYRAKDAGKNCCIVYHNPVDE